MLTTTLLFSIAILAPAKARPVEPPPAADFAPSPDRIPADGVRILANTDEEYRSLRERTVRRVAPDAPSRLVVFSGGVPVLDRGLRLAKRIAGGGDPASPVEEGIAEDAVVSPDGRFAVLATTRYRRAAPSGQELGVPRGVTDVVWIDPAHPEGLWSVRLEDGRWIRRIVPLSARHGVALSTLVDPDSREGDFRIFGPEGIEELRIPESEAVASDIVVTAEGAFVGIDLLFASRPGLPDRGVAVLDRAYGKRWTYTWSYGAEDEPKSWKLEDSGILEVTTPKNLRRFDRAGKPIGSTRRR